MCLKKGRCSVLLEIMMLYDIHWDEGKSKSPTDQSFARSGQSVYHDKMEGLFF